MTGKVVNLRQVRKQKARTEKEEKSAENRTKFGRTKAEKIIDKSRADTAQKNLDGHFLGDEGK